MHPMADHITSAGVIIIEDDGRIYVRKVTNAFAGYKWSFAKGRVEAGVSVEQTALNELREEMGLEAKLLRVLGDYKGQTGITRFFLGEATGGDTSSHGSETEEVRLVSRVEARGLLNVARDRQVLDDAYDLRSSS